MAGARRVGQACCSPVSTLACACPRHPKLVYAWHPGIAQQMLGGVGAGGGSEHRHSSLIFGQRGRRAQALAMGLVNAVVPLARLEQETLVWCREMLRNSPTALRVLKSALNAAEDGQAGLQARRMYSAHVCMNKGLVAKAKT